MIAELINVPLELNLCPREGVDPSQQSLKIVIATKILSQISTEAASTQFIKFKNVRLGETEVTLKDFMVINQNEE